MVMVTLVQDGKLHKLHCAHVQPVCKCPVSHKEHLVIVVMKGETVFNHVTEELAGSWFQPSRARLKGKTLA